MANRVVRVRLDETATEKDVGALRRWLEREQRLDEMVRAGELRIHERRRTDGSGAPMGVGMEIIVAMIGGSASVALNHLVVQVTKAVEAWRVNRREVEDGDPPEGSVDPVDLDG
ncbi:MULTISPECIES: hypothetical protein [Streptomyces]|uniref:hypothetical protein n=1 Tax=Streptomyces TaxID=1883 RepID=UPI000ACA0152|nr:MULTISPECIES: hypothetical protein [Streptomyces]